MSPYWGIAIGAAMLAVSGCSSEAAPLGQLLVVLDTDVPVVDQVITHRELSNDAALDSVRVDVLGADNTPVDFLDVTVPDPSDWPVSFGVQTSSESRVRLRVRLFRAQYATPGEVDHRQTLEPDFATTIDRVVDMPLPEAGITTVGILLAGAVSAFKPLSNRTSR